MVTWKHSLKMLLDEIPPPEQPKYTVGPLLDPLLPTLPDDHAALIGAYGSGEFVYSDIGCVIEVFNPRDPWHMKVFRESHEILRRYRTSQGDDYLPYPVYPETPGVLICATNDTRDYWFWHVNNCDSNQWPTVFYGDMEDFFSFEMPMVVFMQKLFFGEISRSDLNFAEPNFSPEGFRFEPSWRTAEPE